MVTLSGRVCAVTAAAVLMTIIACGDDVPGPTESGQQRSTLSGHPRVYGVWDVTLGIRDVLRGATDTVTVTCGGRLEIDLQRDSLFSGTLILRDDCAQFGGIDGTVTREGEITRLTFTVTVGIGFCEVVEGDRDFTGSVDGRSIAVHATHARRCDGQTSDRELTLTGTRR